MKDILKKLMSAQRKYKSAIGSAEAALIDLVDFEFFLQWQPADGWTIVHIQSGIKVAPLSTCLDIIKEKGRLTEEDFLNNCI